MSQGNVYKPRYKIAFQAKSKIWPYKSSRLRRFFNIRGRKLVRRGFFKRHVIVFNNMKWTIARRYIRPAMRRRKANKRRYRDAFYNKQQLRLFHGKIKEQAFRKFFRRHLIHTVNRNQSFFAGLERRVDIFFFRMRLLPTIFACHQYIHHHGILINRRVEHSPNALLNTGDIVAIQRQHWEPVFWYMHDRLFFRVYGKEISLKRKYTLIKKKTWAIRRWLKKGEWFYNLRKKWLFLNNLLLSRRKKFLLFFEWFLDKLETFLLDNKFKFNKKVEKIVTETFKRLQKLYFSYNKLFFRQLKANLLRKKYARKIFMAHPFKMRHVYKQLFYTLGTNFNLYLRYSSLHTKLKLEEFRFYSLLLSGFEGRKTKKKFKKIIALKESFLVFKYTILRKKVIKYYALFLRKVLKKYTQRSFYKYVPRLKRVIPKGHVLTYFLINRRYKKARRLRIPRLKTVHWAIPRYMHVDFRTMRAVLLYPPKPNEVYYSFKCSLTKISAFYKSLGL